MSRPFSNTSAAATASAPGLPARLRGHWQALAPREQSMLQGAALLVAAALLWWLAQVRSNAKSVPQEVHLVRNNATPPAGAAAAQWDGTLVLALPPR